MPQTKSLFLIYNPKAGGRHRDRLDALVDYAQEQGFTVTLARTEQAGHATHLAGSDAADAADQMIVAGGDGTVNEVLNGLTEDSPPIGFAPFGTANVLAHELHYPKGFKARARAILNGVVRPVRLARANNRAFMLMASVGLDAYAVAGVDGKVKDKIGPLAYIVSGLKALNLYFSGKLKYRVRLDDDAQTYEPVTVIVTRAKKYGGPFTIAPNAGLDQDSLYVVMFMKGGLIALLQYAWGILTSRLDHQPPIMIRKATRVEIDGDHVDPVQVDGDNAGTLPLSIAMTDQQVGLVWPAG